jgi:hypothetical protein
MKFSLFTKKFFIPALMALALLGATQNARANASYFVTIDTSALLGGDASLDAPFYLDFQLNAGSGSAVNTVTLSNFVFSGGSATGATTTYSGSSIGDMASAISMTAGPGSVYNGMFQAFTAGTSSISFTVDLTTNLTGTQPAGFVVSIDDYTTFPIFTNAPDGFSLLTQSVESNANDTLASIETYQSSGVTDGHDTSGVTVTTPESGPGVWLLLALAGTVTVVSRRSRA